MAFDLEKEPMNKKKHRAEKKNDACSVKYLTINQEQKPRKRHIYLDTPSVVVEEWDGAANGTLFWKAFAFLFADNVFLQTKGRP